jgi:hypothetical protein
VDAVLVVVAGLLLPFACLGLVIPTAMVPSLDPHPEIAGLASSIGGAAQMLTGALMLQRPDRSWTTASCQWLRQFRCAQAWHGQRRWSCHAGAGDRRTPAMQDGHQRSRTRIAARVSPPRSA